MAQRKKGRPPSDNSLKDRIFIRVDDDTKEMLDKCTEKLNTTRSDIVRKGIGMVYGSLDKK